MPVQLLKTEDPRSSLERARRSELVEFAKKNGLNEVSEDMPAIVIRQLLRQKGLTNIQTPNRPLGGYVGRETDTVVAAENIPTVDAEADMARQWKAQAEEKPDPDNMSMTELRKTCKALGIKMERTDNLVTLRSKLKASIDG